MKTNSIICQKQAEKKNWVSKDYQEALLWYACKLHNTIEMASKQQLISMSVQNLKEDGFWFLNKTRQIEMSFDQVIAMVYQDLLKSKMYRCLSV